MVLGVAIMLLLELLLALELTGRTRELQ